MKVIKRDGRIVDYDRQKIVIAIEKANKEVRKVETASKQEINKIIEYIEDLNKKRILVEDIQDIIEQKLMELQKFELAKKYIVYRYTRALVRKQNTTDESILGLIRRTNKSFVADGPNKNAVIASTQRNLIAGEVSKDLTKRMLLPEKISSAHEEGILHFHDADYFLQPMTNSCLINLKDMLSNGTVMNDKLIQSPKTFLVACTITTQIISAVASGQYGGVSLDISDLAEYLRKTYKKYKNELLEQYKEKLLPETIESITQSIMKNELRQGVQTIQYQINTLMITNGKTPFVTLFLNLNEDSEYINENAMIIEEILNQTYNGVQNEKGENITPEFPKLIYVLDENNCLKGGKYDYLTQLAIKCSMKCGYPDYISAKKMRENYEGNVFSPIGCRSFLIPWKDEKGNYKFKGRFNQGVVTINLPQIALSSEENEETFWKLLDERLEICKEALMCRHYSLLGTISDVSPVHWKYGAIARLETGEKINQLLKAGYSTLSLGYNGIYETTKVMRGVSHTTKEGREFALKLIKHLKDSIEKWKKETGLGFVLYGTPEESVAARFASIDREKFGTIEDITDKWCYTNSYHINANEKVDIFTKLSFENDFQKHSLGGAKSCINVSELTEATIDPENLIRFIYENVQYVEFNVN